MGVDICFFLDHDLPMDNPQIFYEELKKRISGKEIILNDYEKTPFNEMQTRKNVWYVLYGFTFPDISLDYKDDIYEIHIELYKNVAYVNEINKDGEIAFDYLRFHRMLTLFQENKNEGKEWFTNMINTLRSTVLPILHSKKLLLTADSSSYRHETLYGDYLMEQGKTIEEALEMNESFTPPCKVWKNKEAFGRPEDDYYGNGDDWIDPFFLFDLDQF